MKTVLLNSLLLALPFFISAQSWTFLSDQGSFTSPVLFETQNNDLILQVNMGAPIGGASPLTKFYRLNQAGEVKWETDTYERGAAALLKDDEIVLVNSKIYRFDNFGEVVWNGVIQDQEAFAVTATNDGGFAVAGFSDPDKVRLHKYDASSDLIWSMTTTVEPSTNISFKTKDIVELPDGRLLLYGYNVGKVESNMVLVDSEGNEIWNHLIPQVDTVGLNMVEAAPHPDGGFVGGGTLLIASPGLPRSGYVAKADANGVPEWQTTIDVLSDDAFTDLEITPAGDILICGWSEDITTPPGVSIFVANLDADGEVQWLQTYDVPFDFDYFDPATRTPRIFHFGNEDRFFLGWNAAIPGSGDLFPALLEMDMEGALVNATQYFEQDDPSYQSGKLLEMIATANGSFAVAGLLHDQFNNSAEYIFVIQETDSLFTSNKELLPGLGTIWEISPNPAQNWIQIKGPGSANLNLYNPLGQLVGNWLLKEEETVIDLNLPAGTYFYLLQREDQIRQAGKLQVH